MLAQLGQKKSFIDEQGWQLVLVHPGPDESSRLDAKPPGLEEVDQISDPHCELYRSFGLGKGSLLQLFGPQIFIGGLKAFKMGHRGGMLHGDALQLSGMFLVEGREIVKSHLARDASDIGRLEGFVGKSL